VKIGITALVGLAIAANMAFAATWTGAAPYSSANTIHGDTKPRACEEPVSQAAIEGHGGKTAIAYLELFPVSEDASQSGWDPCHIDSPARTFLRINKTVVLCQVLLMCIGSSNSTKP